MNVRFFLSHNIKINQNHMFWHETVKILSSFMQHYIGCNYVTLQDLYCYDFMALARYHVININ